MYKVNRTSIYSSYGLLLQRGRACISQLPLSHLINPYTNEYVSDKKYITNDEMFDKVTATVVSQRKWKEVKLEKRVESVRNLVQSVLADKQLLKPIIASEIGKSYHNIEEEFRRIQRLKQPFIESGRGRLKSKIVEEYSHKLKKISFEPVGLALIFPYFSQPIFDSLINLIPCLISGNGALLKVPDYNHFLGPYLERKTKEATGRSCLVSDVFIQPEQLQSLAQFRSIKKVIYSGSQESAKHIFETLVRKRFIDCNLFFGGQDAAYVDESADLHQAARQIVNNAFYNNGQSYDCIKRLYIDQKVESSLIKILKEEIQNVTLGDPTDSGVILGPLCNAESANDAQKQISDAISQGAACEIGGLSTTDGRGAGVFFEPTLLRNCQNDMLVVQNKINAPIICAISIRDRQDFCRQVNQNQYGTGIRIFTREEDKYKDLIGKMQVGRISFNSGSMFDVNLPIEGWKQSGKGKILSQLSFSQFSVPKSYNIKYF